MNIPLTEEDPFLCPECQLLGYCKEARNKSEEEEEVEEVEEVEELQEV